MLPTKSWDTGTPIVQLLFKTRVLLNLVNPPGQEYICSKKFPYYLRTNSRYFIWEPTILQLQLQVLTPSLYILFVNFNSNQSRETIQKPFPPLFLNLAFDWLNQNVFIVFSPFLHFSSVHFRFNQTAKWKHKFPFTN